MGYKLINISRNIYKGPNTLAEVCKCEWFLLPHAVAHRTELGLNEAHAAILSSPDELSSSCLVLEIPA